MINKQESVSAFFGLPIKEATIDHLEVVLAQLVEIREILLSSGLESPAATWSSAIHAVECELLERILLQ